MSGRCILLDCENADKVAIVEILKINSHYSKVYFFSTNIEKFPKALRHLKNHVKVWTDERKIDVTQNALIIMDIDAMPCTEKEWIKLLNDIPYYKIDLKCISESVSTIPLWILNKCPFISKINE